MSRKLNRNSVLGAMAAVAAVWASGSPVLAQAGPAAAKAIYDKASPSFVAVSYVWESELRRQEIVATGIVVADDGTVMFPLGAWNLLVPDIQMKEFKIYIPKFETDHEELEAVFLGRDERHNVAFARIKDATKKVPALTFVDKHVDVADKVYSIGLLPKESGYKTFLSIGNVSANLRGETPTVLITGSLADVGGVAFTEAGEAVGYILPQGQSSPLLEPRNPQAPDVDTRYFVPASEFLPAIATPPVPGAPDSIPYAGIFGLNGLNKDLAEVFGLTGKPAVEITDIAPGSPAEKAGLAKGMIIVEFDGQKIEQADQPEELGGILGKKIILKKIGDVATFTVIAKKGAEPKKVAVTLTARPPQATTAARFYADDLGYTVRDAVFQDLYRRHLPLDSKGVVVDLIKPQGAAATARLARGDIVTQLNSQPVTDVAAFKTSYEAFRKDKPKDALVLQVIREGNTQIIRIEPPQ